jgi:hypothetical protein
MKCDSLILTVIVGCFLFTQAGCEQKKSVSVEPGTSPVQANQTGVPGSQEVLTPRPPGPVEEG